MDEACALIKTEMDSMPRSWTTSRRKIMQLEIEEAALKKETDKHLAGAPAEIQKELADLRASSAR